MFSWRNKNNIYLLDTLSNLELYIQARGNSVDPAQMPHSGSTRFVIHSSSNFLTYLKVVLKKKRGWSDGAKVLCILRHLGVQMILA